MIRITTVFTGEKIIDTKYLSAGEAAQRASLYALTGVPIAEQGDMSLAEALRYAQRRNLRRPNKSQIQRAFSIAAGLSQF